MASGNSIAKVISVSGQVFISNTNGELHQLTPNSLVYLGDRIITASNGEAKLAMANGENITINATTTLGSTTHTKHTTEQATENTTANAAIAHSINELIADTHDTTVDDTTDDDATDDDDTTENISTEIEAALPVNKYNTTVNITPLDLNKPHGVVTLDLNKPHSFITLQSPSTSNKDGMLNNEIPFIENIINQAQAVTKESNGKLASSSLRTSLNTEKETEQTTNTLNTLTAIEKITAYSSNSNNPKPTLQDYLDARIMGVNATNINAINLSISDGSGSAIQAIQTIVTSVASDTIVPTVTITSNEATLTAGEAANITFTFSERPRDFSAADIDLTAANGAITNLIQDPNNSRVYTATFTPTTNTDTSNNVISVGTAWSDRANNAPTAHTSSATYTINTVLPTLTMNQIASDGIINATEDNSPVTFSGTTNAEAGQIVTISLNNETYQATVNSSSSWSVDMTSSQAQAISDGSHTVTANVSNAVGNAAIAESSTITVDTTAPTLTINPITNDGIINATEDNSPVTISGTTNAETGQIVTISLNNETYQATVNSSASWSVDMTSSQAQAISDGSHTVTANVSDAAGNAAIAESSTITVDTTAPTLTITSNQTSLTAGGTANITFTFSEAPINFDLNDVTWSTASGAITQPVQDTSNTLVYTATFTPTTSINTSNHVISVGNAWSDNAGNAPAASSSSPTYSVNTVLPTLTINQIASDDIINATESNSPVTFSGTTNAEAGQVVTISLNNQTYEATVNSSSSWSVDMTSSQAQAISDGSHTVTANVSNAVGNAAIAESSAITVDTTAPTLTITSNQTSLTAGGTANITFTFSEAPINFDLNDVTWSTASGAITQPVQDTSNTLVYTATFTPTTSINTSNHVISVGNAWSDNAGNAPAASSSSPTYSVNTVLPTLTINQIANDDIINATESNSPVTFSGTTNAEAGQVVTISLNNQTYEATVSSSSSWSVDMTSSQAQAISDGSHTVTANVSNAVGNAAIAESSAITVDTTAPTLTITSNQTSLTAGGTANITFTFSEAPINFDLNDVTWSTASGAITQPVQDTSNTLVYTATFTPTTSINTSNHVISVGNAWSDNAGNAPAASSSSPTYSVNTVLPTLTINQIANDDIINATESNSPVTFSGTTNAEAGQIVTISLNNQTYEATVSSSSSWSVDMTSSQAQAISDGSHTVTANVSNAVGNAAIAESSAITVDTTAPTLTITSNQTSLTAGGTANITFTFSEAPINFDLNDVTWSTASGAITQPVQDTSNTLVYTATFTPTTSINTSNHVISVGNAWSDNAGNAPAASSSSPTYSVNTVLPTLTINQIANDDIINATESNSPVTFSGTTNAEAGQVVTISLNNQTYEATVSSSSSWSVDMTSSQAQAISDGSHTVTANVSNAVGNAAIAESSAITVDTTAPTLTMNQIASDGIINATESNSPVTFSGTTNAEAGQVVTISLNNQTYEATVSSSSSWSVDMTSSQAQAISDGSHTVTANVSNAVGNAAIAESSAITVDTTAPTLTITSNQTSLTAGGTANITFTFSEAPINFDLNDVTWSTASGAITQPVQDTSNTLVYTATFTPTTSINTSNHVISVGNAWSDNAGNAPAASSSSPTYSVNTVLPTLTINQIANDDIINATESNSPVTFSGTTNAEAGQVVTISLNNQTYEATVSSSSSWSVDMTSSQAQAISDGSHTVTANVSNAVGNAAIAESSAITVDTTAPTLTITSNQTSLTAGGTANITFTFSEAPINFDLNDVTWSTASGAITQPVQDTSNTLVYTATFTPTTSINTSNHVISVGNAWSDNAGNAPAASSSSPTYSVNTVLPTLTINQIANDDIINATESNSPVTFSGTTNAEAGQVVTISLNNQTYEATVSSSSSWSVDMTSSQAQAISDGSHTVTANVSNAVGNAAIAESSAITVDTTAPTLTITSNQTSLTAGGTANITFTFSEAPINFDLNDVTWSTASGAITQPVQDTSNTLVYTATFTPTTSINTSNHVISVGNAWSDNAGNAPAASSSSPTYSVNTVLPTLTINQIANDDIINATESNSPVTFSGTTNAEAGQVVTISLNNQTYEATVSSSSSWSVDMTSSQAQAISDGSHTVTANVSNAVGNAAIAESSAITVDTTAPTLTITSNQTSLTAGGTANITFTFSEAPINFDLNDVTWSTASGAITQPVQDTSNTLVYTATFTPTTSINTSNHVISVGNAWSDNAGNAPAASSSSPTYSVNTVLPTLTINQIANDDIINATESNSPVTFSGTTNAEAGQVVTISLNNQTYEATVSSSSSWSVDMTSSQAQAISDGSHTVTANVSNAVGNAAIAESSAITVDTTAPTLTITSNQTSLTAGGTANITFTFSEAPINFDLNDVTWSTASGAITQPVQDTSNTLVYTATFTPTTSINTSNHVISVGNAWSDNAGNAPAASSSSPTYSVNTVLPTLTINQIANDDIINATESNSPVTFSGTTNAEAGQVVTISLNNQTYEATVSSSSSWSVDMTSSQAQAISDGSHTVTANVSNAVGNAAIAESSAITVDTTAPTLTITSNQTSLTAGGTANITFTFSEAPINFDLNDVTWSTASGAITQPVQDTSNTLVYTATFTPTTSINTSNHVISVGNAWSDNAGNAPAASSSSPTYSVNTVLPTLTINQIANDDIINATESNSPVTFSGTTNAEAGQVVTISLNNQTYEATVSSSSSWSVDMTSSQAQAISDGSHTVTANVSNAVGNAAIAESSAITVDTTAPTLTITSNQTSLTAGGTANITFTFSEAPINFDLNDVTWSTASGAITQPVQDTSNTLVYTATFTPTTSINTSNHVISVGNAWSDNAGNAPAASSSSPTYSVNTVLPTLTINQIANDDIINATESNSPVTFSGTTNAEAGQVVTISLNNQTYEATVSSSSSWSVDMTSSQAQAISDGSHTVTANVSNAVGNAAIAESSAITVDTTAPTLTITSNQTSLTAGGTANITFTFSEAPINFDLNDVTWSTASGAITQPVQDTSNTLVYTATFTPTTSINTSNHVISVGNAWSDNAGNAPAASSSSPTYSVNTVLPTLTINQIANDDIINATESNSPVTFSGTTNAEAGQVVTISLNNQTYEATVSSSSSWSVDMTSSQAQAISDGSHTVTANVSNAVGNAAIAESSAITVDTTAPTLTITSNQTSLTAGGTANITFTFSEAPINFDLNDVTWSTASGAITQPVQDTSNTLVYTATFTPTTSINTSNHVISVGNAWSDNAGNAPAASSSSPTYSVNTVLPTLTINQIANDDIINATESNSPVTFSGTTNAEAGQVVTISLNNQTYEATVSSSSSWSVDMTSSQAQAISDGSHTVTANVSNAVGNAAIAESSAITVDTTAPTLTITSNQTSLTAGGTANITFTFSEAPINFDLNDVTWSTASGAITQPVQDTSNTLVYTATFTPTTSINTSNHVISVGNAWSDNAGNAPAASSSSPTYSVNTVLPTLTINQIANDDIINATESNSPVTFSGTTNAEAGQVVTISLNNQTYEATVSSSSSWSVDMTSSQAQAISDGSHTVTANVSNAVGNAAIAESSAITVDTTAPTLTITSNQTSLTAGGTANITFTFSEAPINFDLNDVTWSTASGAITQPVQDTSNTLVYTATFTPTTSINTSNHVISVGNAWSDNAGNAPAASSSSPTYSVNTVLPTLTINQIANDDIINATESNSPVTFSGTTNAEAGQVVTISLNNQTYEATVSSSSSWSVDMTSSQAQAISDGSHTVTANVSNAVGNAAIAESSAITVDTTAPTLTITSNQTSLTAGGTANITFTFSEAPINFDLNDVTWSTASGAITQPVQDTSNTLVYTATFTPTTSINTSNHVISVGNAWSDNAGNAPAASSSSPTYSVNTVLPTLTINQIANDDIINATESNSPVTFSGTTNAEAGQVVTISLNNQTYEATVSSSSSWSVDMTSSQAQAISDGSHTVTANVSNAVGNAAIAGSSAITVDTTAPTLTINPITNDGIINATEDNSPVTISGTTNAEAGQVVTISLNGQTYQPTVNSSSFWSVNMTSSQAQAISDGTHTVTANVSDAAGNAAIAKIINVIVDTTPPSNAPTIISVEDNVGDVITGTLSNNAQTDDEDLLVRVSLSGTNAVVGDTVQLFNSSNALGTPITVTATNVSAGFAEITTPTLTSGAYTLNAKVIDEAGNSSPASASLTINVNTTVPSTPTSIVLATDSGSSTSDDITNSGVVNVTLASTLATGEKWQYSTNSGASWIVGTGGTSNTSVTFTLNEGSYTAGQVRVRISNNLGSSSSSNQLLDALKIDSTAPSAATLSLASASINKAQANAGVEVFNGISSPFAPDISTIKITIGGAALDTTLDKLVLDAAKGLGASFSTSSAVIVGSISVTYSFNQSTSILSISKADGHDFTRGELTSVAEAIQFKTNSTTNGARTFVITYEDKAGNASAAVTSTITGTNLAITALTTTPTITSISNDTGVSNDYITSDNNGLTIVGTISQSLGTNEILEYSTNGSTWVNISSYVTSTGISYSYADSSLTASATVRLRVRNTSSNKESAVVEQKIVIDTSAPSIDLSSNIGDQHTATTTVTASEANTGKVIFGDIQDTSASDITSIKIVMGGANLDTANDQIVLDAAKNIHSNFSVTSGVTIGGVTGVNYDYNSSTKTLTITMNGGGAFSAQQVNDIQPAIKYKSTSATPTEGDRTFVISYTDVAANTSAVATQTVQLDFTAPSISASRAASTSVTGYQVITLGEVLGTNDPRVLNVGESIDITGVIPAGTTAAAFLNSLIGLKGALGGVSVASGANNLSGQSKYKGLSDLQSNTDIKMQFEAGLHIKELNLRFILNSTGTTLALKNNSAAYTTNVVPYQNPTVTNSSTGYGLGAIKLYSEVALSVVDNSPDINVTYNGGNAKVGDTIELLEGSTVIATYILTSSDIGAGNKTVRVSSNVPLPEGTHNLTIQYTDTAGNRSPLSTVSYTVAAAEQNIDMHITGIRTTEYGQAAADQLIGTDSYVTTGSRVVTFMGVQDVASFITIFIGDILLFAGHVSRGSFAITVGNGSSIRPGVHNVVITSTNIDTGIVNVEQFTMGWFKGAEVTDTIIGSDFDDHIAPGSTAATDVITTKDGHDVIHFTQRQRGNTNYEITDFTVGQDTINANAVVSGLTALNITDYASITYNAAGDAVVRFDSNGASAGGQIYSTTLTNVKSVTLSDVFSFTNLSSTIIWNNIGSDQIISPNESLLYSLSGAVTNPNDLSGLQISSIDFTSIDGTATTLTSNLPLINSTTGAWTLSHVDFPSLTDGRYTVTVNFSANGGFTQSLHNAEVVIIDIVEPTVSQSTSQNTTITLTMDEYLDASSVPTTSAFVVAGHTVTGVAISGKTVELTVVSTITSTVNVSYTKPSSGNVLKNQNGTEVASINGLSVTPPIIIDLNRDGELSYSEAIIDINRDGQLEYSGWVAAEDGVLFFDKYNDGQWHDSNQIAFQQFGGNTDLEGLKIAFDSNNDGVFDAQDTQFEQFSVFQDLNQDGLIQTGELQTLTELGIKNIQLLSDGIVNEATSFTVELGRTTAELADGSNLVVGDVVFKYQELDIQTCLPVNDIESASDAQTIVPTTTVSEASSPIIFNNVVAINFDNLISDELKSVNILENNGSILNLADVISFNDNLLIKENTDDTNEMKSTEIFNKAPDNIVNAISFTSQSDILDSILIDEEIKVSVVV